MQTLIFLYMFYHFDTWTSDLIPEGHYCKPISLFFVGHIIITLALSHQSWVI